MAEKGFKRKLAAILSADVAGYSRLMRDDEEATVRTLTTFRTAITHIIDQYRGRVVDSPGDNILAEFTSVVDAVNCGVEIQRELAERNAEFPEDRRMKFRIGINLGDVLEEGKRIYGDGVNIAARMESLAEAGEICLSGTVYDAIENKIGLEYDYLGEQEVKNIDKPVRAYRVLSYPGAATHRVDQAKTGIERKWPIVAFIIVVVLILGAGAGAIWQFYLRPSAPPVEVTSENAAVPEIPAKPTIAVISFDNLTGDPSQEYFSRGITEEIITGLSKIKRLYVVASHSTLMYKGKAVDVRQVGKDLGVRYVLEGNVRKDGERVRITAQLLDANTGHHLWVKSYDRNFKDIFALQDDVTMKIMKAMRVELTQGEQAQLWGRYDTDNPEIYERHLKAHYHLFRGTKEDNIIARQLWEETINLDPNFAVGYMKLGWTYYFDVLFGSESPNEAIKKSFEYAHKALSMDDSIELTHSLLSCLYLMKGESEKAMSEAKRGVELNPNGSDALSCLAWVYLVSGMAEEAIPMYLKAIRLNSSPGIYLFKMLGESYLFTNRDEEAIEAFKKALRINSSYFPAKVRVAAAYGLLNRDKEAQIAVKEIIRIRPEFSIKDYEKILDSEIKIQAYKDRLIMGMRKAGLPD